MRRSFLILTILLSLCLAAEGSAPRKGTFLMRQPDGTSFLARLKGDEFCKLMTTGDGCAVIRQDDGFYYYASFKPDGSRLSSGYKVGSETPSAIISASRSIPWKALKGKTSAIRRERREIIRFTPATRSSQPIRKHCIVILAQFQDVKFTNEESRRQEFTNLIKKEGANSVLDYFNDQFQGKYVFNFTIGPIVTLSENMEYYGKNDEDKAGIDMRPQELVREACILSDIEVDFSQYDDDNDGIVDNVFVIVAGKSEAEGGDANCLWPHQWYVPNLSLDGKRILSYALSTELTVKSQNSSGQMVWGMSDIGPFCHEYSHTLGLDDYYDTDEEGSGGTADGMWISTALMDGGNFNNSSHTPPYYNALDRDILGIGQPETMRIGTITLEPVSENGRYIILENPNEPEEFFLFECRVKKGWDTYIGGEGLAIYHVDMSGHDAGWSDQAAKRVSARRRWEDNEVNCNPSFECADMIETSESAMSVRQAFFPYKTINSFSATSKPAFIFNDGTESPFAISGINFSGGKVSFTVYDSSEIIPKAVDASVEPYQDAAIISWQSDVEGYEGDATVTWGTSSGSLKTETVKPYESGKYALTLEGLSPTTAYTLNIFFERHDVSGETVTIDFLTKASQSGGKPFIYLEYLSGSRVNGKFPAGVGLPLRVYNAIGEKVNWSYDGSNVSVDGSGYYHPAKSGALKAVVYHSDGSKDILYKEITIQ